ncbi:Lar family restriction alleviation protein [Adlercreutzia sp. ZJ242]|uniref:Lar family restriction alleviation protein n=1 Tax=Adlercreutzia sp. ZJ242 TaxID=2709409 RepID=UPI00351BBACA
MIELRPCPFCGNVGDPQLIHAGVNMWYVKCCNCGTCCGGAQLSAEMAVDKWNHRAERTCKNLDTVPEDRDYFYPAQHFECSECGHRHVSMSYVFYCPSCGAKVVDDDD